MRRAPVAPRTRASAQGVDLLRLALPCRRPTLRSQYRVGERMPCLRLGGAVKTTASTGPAGASGSAGSAGWITSLRTALSEELPAAVALRRALHAEPELSGHEQRNAARCAAALGQPGAADVSGGRLIKIGNGDAPVIAVRAELDALPIVEDTGVTWAARNGAAHACGHDVHLAALVALARALQRYPGP